MEPTLDELNESLEIVCSNDGERLDSFCANNSELSRSRIEALCEQGGVLVNSKPQKKNYRLKNGDAVCIYLPDNDEIDAVPQDIPIKVVYEDDDIIVVDKQAGMVVHPAAGNPDNTLVNALLFHCKGTLSGINGKIRPGIVHRLDKDTSGLIICAKNDAAHAKISSDIKEHRYIKIYNALCYGHIDPPEGTVRLAIGRSKTDRKKMCAYPWDSPNAKNAVTHYKTIREYEKYSLLEINLETGRTHQIRVHLASLGHPVVADPLYAPKRETLGLDGQFLHAAKLIIDHPVTGKKMEFVSPLPERLEKALGKIR